jgi:carbon monoxide dehydrogenase subunit G
MKIEGQYPFENLSADVIWKSLTDPDGIASCLPGCERLTPTADGAYEMTITFGVGAIRGKFAGNIRLHDIHPTTDYGMTVSGSGSVGFVNGEGSIRVSPTETGTQVVYAGDVAAGGAIASVGQRMIGGAARLLIDQFFKRVAAKCSAKSNIQ